MFTSIKKFSWVALLLALTLASPESPAKPHKTFTTAGDIGQIVIPVSALAISYFKEDDLTGTKQFAKSFLSTMAATYAIKYSFDVKRPNGGKHSFPSGHASSSFSGASFLGFRYGSKYGIPFYLAAAAVGLSRIDAKKHSLADVGGSVVLSTLCSYIFTTPYPTKAKVQVAPVMVRSGYGAAVDVAL